MANSKCKKKQRKPLSSFEKEMARNHTFQNKLRKLEKQVRENPNDQIAIYNLAMFRAEGRNAKGFAG